MLTTGPIKRQTGSGKTFTMVGPPGDRRSEHRGVNIRAIGELFERSAARDCTDAITVSVLEVTPSRLVLGLPPLSNGPVWDRQ